MKHILNYKDYLIENLNNFSIHNFNSFNDLKEKDLYIIAERGLSGKYPSVYDVGDWQYSGVWDMTDNLKEAVQLTVDYFKQLLFELEFPEGFKNIPEPVPCYRFVYLKSLDDFKQNSPGVWWFNDTNIISNTYKFNFFSALPHLKGENDVYLISALINQNKINIPYTLFSRDCNYEENEILLKDDKDGIKIVSFVNKKNITDEAYIKL